MHFWPSKWHAFARHMWVINITCAHLQNGSAFLCGMETHAIVHTFLNCIVRERALVNGGTHGHFTPQGVRCQRAANVQMICCPGARKPKWLLYHDYSRSCCAPKKYSPMQNKSNATSELWLCLPVFDMHSITRQMHKNNTCQQEHELTRSMSWCGKAASLTLGY